jgi:hypothetical protein
MGEQFVENDVADGLSFRCLGLVASGQELDIAVAAVDTNPLLVSNELCGAFDADDGRQPIFAGDDRAVRHEPSDLGDEAPDGDEQGRPAGLRRSGGRRLAITR